MKTKITTLAGVALMATTAVAQNQYGALQFMGNELNGTARFVGMGGAMSALGADLSTISTNPAGIGLYRSNDMALSFGFNNTRTTSDWSGISTSEKRNRASFDQAGFVWSTKIGNTTNLRYVNFGFNYHKRANFNRQFYGKGNLNGASLTYQMANLVDGVCDTKDQFNTLLDAGSKSDPRNPYTHSDFYAVPYLALMGARTGLVDANWDDKGNITQIFGWDGRQGEYFSREQGGINQYDFNLSFNVLDRFYFGMTMGLYTIDYNLYSSYGEMLNRNIPAGNGQDAIRSEGDLTLNNIYKAKGSGVDVKLGAIIRPFEYSPFRIGLSVHTPVWYNMTDRYTAVLNTTLTSSGGGEPASYTENLSEYFQPDSEYLLDYRFATPWRFNVSAGSVFAGIMAVDAEYEYEKYSSSKITDMDGNELNATKAISQTLKGVHTFRVGMETKLTDAFSVRAGYNFQSSPIKTNSFKNIAATDNTRTDAAYWNPKSRQAVTVGVGYRGRLLYADLAYKYDFYKSDFYAFDDEKLTPAQVNTERHQLLFTVGVHF